MLSALSNPSPARERLAAFTLAAARLSFGTALFLSPLALQWVQVRELVKADFPDLHYFLFYTSDIFLLLTLSFWLLSFIYAPRPLQLEPGFITVPLLALVGLSWIGIFTGIDPGTTVYHTIRFALLFLLVLFLVGENISPVCVAVPLALGVVVQAAVGLAQFVVQGPLGLRMLGEMTTLDPGLTGTSIIRVGAARFLRAYGLTVHPNILGGYIAFGLMLVLGYYLSVPASRRARLFLLLALAVGSVGLLVSFSRAAALALLSGVLLLSLLYLANAPTRAARWKELALVVVVVGAALVVPAGLNQALLTQRVGGDDSFTDNPGEQRSISEREALFASAARLYYRYEMFGVGNGALTLAMQQLDDQFPKEYGTQPAHFVLMDVAAELGLPGAAIWLWLILAPWAAVIAKREAFLASPWMAATAAALLVMTVVGLFDYYPWLSECGRLWQWSAWGLFGAAYTRASTIRKVSPTN